MSRNKPTELTKLGILWMECFSPLTDAMPLIKGNIEQMWCEFFQLPEVSEATIIENFVGTCYNHSVLPIFNFLCHHRLISMHGWWCNRKLTLNKSLVADAPVTLAALMPNLKSSSTFLSPKMLSAVMIMIILLLLKRSGIQKVRVLPEPVGEIIIQSICLSCAMASRAWNIHGKIPKALCTSMVWFAWCWNTPWESQKCKNSIQNKFAFDGELKRKTDESVDYLYRLHNSRSMKKYKIGHKNEENKRPNKCYQKGALHMLASWPGQYSSGTNSVWHSNTNNIRWIF